MLNVSTSRDPGPLSPAELHQKGIAAYKAGRLDEAAACFTELTRLLPGDAGVWEILGIVQHRRGNLDQAAEAFERSIRIRPEVQALNNLGATLLDGGRYEEAIVPLKDAVRRAPSHVPSLHNLAKALIKQGKTRQAVGHLAAALKISSNNPELMATQGVALMTSGRSGEGAAMLRQSLGMRPHPGVHSQLLMALHEAAEEPGVIFSEARRWDELYARPLKGDAGFANDRDPDRPLRVGYLSADFCIHPVASFFEPLLLSHDPAQVQPWCYSSVRRADGVTGRLKGRAPMWRDVSMLSDEQVAASVLGDQIDILVDLGGHTSGNRLLVAARQPAPVQVTYLGFPASTGVSAIEYRITEGLLDVPGEAEKLHSEKIIRLPGPFATYLPPDSAPDVTPLPMLGNGFCTFGSSSSRGKINYPTLRTWARILGQAPGSRLRLYVSDVETDAPALLPAFESQGIARERIQLRARQDIQHYLASHGEIDILLDTFPLSGHTVICHALWMGVPAVCMRGATCWERLGSSVMSHVNLPETIATSAEDYIHAAVKLADDPARMSALRGSMRERMKNSPLMDYRAHARQVESVFRQMWRNWIVSR
jgi:predicted O-linked N-acetylglucosamine transferase (SPINDLY family)